MGKEKEEGGMRWGRASSRAERNGSDGLMETSLLLWGWEEAWAIHRTPVLPAWPDCAAGVLTGLALASPVPQAPVGLVGAIPSYTKATEQGHT